MARSQASFTVSLTGVIGMVTEVWMRSTGNIANDKLEKIVRGHVLEIIEAFEAASFIELGRESLTVHE